MLKQLFFCTALTFSIFSGQAQALPPVPAPPPTLTAAPRTSSDTIRAISRLYARRRRGGHNWLYVSSIGVLSLIRVLASPGTSNYGGYTVKNEVDGGAVALFGVGFLVAPAAYGTSKLVRFSEKREREAIDRFSATHRLPAGMATHLRRKDFNLLP